MIKSISQGKKIRINKPKFIASDNYQKSLAEKILIEAKKMAILEVTKLAEQVLTEATTIARWEKKPFYIA